jgi:hypothetical protein
VAEAVGGATSLGLARSEGLGLLSGEALLAGLFVSVGSRRGDGLGVGETALATSPKARLTKTIVIAFVNFIEGSFRDEGETVDVIRL